MKLFEFINKCLNAYGCKKAFGVPGSLVMPIWQGLTDLELSLCGHEQEASYCASGYAKMSLEPVAVITTGSPGVTNCISGIAGGYMDSVPLIYISGRTATFDAGNGLRQEESRNNRCFDSIDIMQSITKKSILIKTSETAAKDFEDICTLALKVRKGTVHISIPENIQNEEIGYVNIEELYKRAEKFKDHINANEIIRQDFTGVINNSKRKLIIMGWGCWLSQSIEAVYELAKRINAPILVTAKAFCCASENSMLLGKLGYGENPIMKEFLKKYKPELVLAFGTSMSKKDISDDIRELLPMNNTHIFTIEPEDSNKYFRGVWHKVEDLKKTIKSLLQVNPLSQNIEEIVLEYRRKQKEYYHNYIDENDLMARTISQINCFNDQSIIVTADAGNHLLNTAVLFDAKQKGQIFINDGIRAMGSGICETVGMAIANSNYKYIAITGDGCMLMNGNVMHMASKKNLPVLFVVYANLSLGRVRVGQMVKGKIIESDLPQIDFFLYAKSMGLDAISVNDVDGFYKYVEGFIKEPRPALIEVCTDSDEIPIALKAKGEWN